MQGSFLCAEAHPDLGELLLVLSISESLLTWHDYCKALPATVPTDDNNHAATNNSCVHPAVLAATQKVMHACNDSVCDFALVVMQYAVCMHGSAAQRPTGMLLSFQLLV